MAHGFIAKNDFGVVVCSDQKTFVFRNYYPAPSPSNSVYVFTVAETAASLYGIRLAAGGQGAVISVVGATVTVLGSGVLGLLVFSPITAGGTQGHGIALFNSAGECTFDSTQKPLVVTAAGNLSPGGTLYGTGDTVVYMGVGVYAQKNVSEKHGNVYTSAYGEGIIGISYVNTFGRRVNTRVTYTNTVTNWTIHRNVVQRGAGFVSGVTQFHLSGSYTFMTNIQRWSTSQEGGSRFYAVSSFENPYGGSISSRLESDTQALISQQQAKIASTNQFPYATANYNTSQNSILLLDSSIYLG